MKISLFGEWVDVNEQNQDQSDKTPFPIGKHAVWVGIADKNDKRVRVRYENNDHYINTYFNIYSGSSKAINYHKAKLAQLCQCLGITNLTSAEQLKGGELEIEVIENIFADKSYLEVKYVRSLNKISNNAYA